MLFGIIDGYKFVGYRGLASHGATIGIITAMFIYKYKFKYDSVLWIFDRLAIPVAIGGMFVRIGNFFNSEIVGNYTNSNFGIVFKNRGEIIFLKHIDVLNFSDDNLLTNPIAAIYTPFSFILVYEVFLVVYYLPRSISQYIRKQYEIITLIIVRSILFWFRFTCILFNKNYYILNLKDL